MKPVLFIALMMALTQTFAQDLQSYIGEAEANNPQIRAFELRYDMAVEKVKEVNSLPNTVVSAGYFVSEPETRTGPQKARFSVSQMLPWFGTITARQEYAGAVADAEFLEISIAKRKLAMSVAQSYYVLYELRAKQQILDQNIRLLKTWEELALTSLEVGNASAVDVLRLQIRQNELQQQTKLLQEAFRAEETAFNNLLNREETIGVDILAALALPETDPEYPTDALTLNSELLKYDKLYESVVLAEEMNQKESAPNIGFGVDYVPVAERTDMAMDDNGKDVVMPMVTLSIPLFNNKYSSVSRQNALRQMEIETQKEDRLNVLQNMYAQALSRRNQARISYETQEVNLQRARDAEEILTRNYETGTIDFDELLEIQQMQLRFGMEQVEAVRRYYEQSAIINYLVNQ